MYNPRKNSIRSTASHSVLPWVAESFSASIGVQYFQTPISLSPCRSAQHCVQRNDWWNCVRKPIEKGRGEPLIINRSTRHCGKASILDWKQMEEGQHREGKEGKWKTDGFHASLGKAITNAYLPEIFPSSLPRVNVLCKKCSILIRIDDLKIEQNKTQLNICNQIWSFCKNWSDILVCPYISLIQSKIRAWGHTSYGMV